MIKNSARYGYCTQAIDFHAVLAAHNACRPYQRVFSQSEKVVRSASLYHRGVGPSDRFLTILG